MIGTIFDIKEMAVHDGPGLRTTVFFKGCPLRCKWCHNPEGLLMIPQVMYKKARCIDCGCCKITCMHEECKEIGRCIFQCPQNCMEIVGKRVETKALAKELRESAEILGDSFGGFTFSGGEPLAQPQFLMGLMEELKDYHLCIETSGYAPHEVFLDAVEKSDMVIMDIKIADSNVHEQFTGVSNEIILENFRILRESKKQYIIRTPLISNITDKEENLNEIKKIIGDSFWEKLPYNEFAGSKYEMLGMEYEL